MQYGRNELEGYVELTAQGYDFYIWLARIHADDDERLFNTYCGGLVNSVVNIGRGILCRKIISPGGDVIRIYYCKHCHWNQSYDDVLDEDGNTKTGRDLLDTPLAHHQSCPMVYHDCMEMIVLFVKRILKTDRLEIKTIDTLSDISK